MTDKPSKVPAPRQIEQSASATPNPGDANTHPPVNMSLPAPSSAVGSLGLSGGSSATPPKATKTGGGRWFKTNKSAKTNATSPQQQAKDSARFQKQAQDAARNTAKQVVREMKWRKRLQEREAKRRQQLIDNPDAWQNRLVDPTRVVFLATGVAMVVALVVSVAILAIPGKYTKARLAANTKQVARTPLGDQQKPKQAQEQSAAVPEIAAVTSLDADGQDSEHPEWIDRILDQNPNTKWMSRYYSRPKFGVGGGIGISVTLKQKATVKQITVDSTANGGVIEVRLPSTTGYPRDGELIATGTFGPGQVITLNQPTSLDTFFLWFPELPKDPQGRYRATITNLNVS